MPRRDAELKERLLATFRVEADEHVEALFGHLAALADGGPQAEALLETTFRDMHTLKGAARSVGLREVERVCAACEALLSALTRAGTLPAPALLALLEEAVGAVARLISEGGVPAGDLVQRLQNATTDPQVAAPRSAPEPKAAPAPRPATIRLGTAELDELLRRGEDLLAIKLAADEWVADAADLLGRLRRTRRAADPAAALRSLEGQARAMLNGLQRDRRAIAAAVDGLLAETRRVRMTPASTVLDIVPRMLRDLARSEGKDAGWEATGGELLVDRRVIEAIKDPLIHIVRNAVDHGIEPPDERVAAGKPARGQVAAAVRALEGGRIEVVISDDGRGIDPERVQAAARRARIESAEDPLALVFRSGLSTSFVITDVSGHGLGLAIVKDQVERLGGAVTLESRPGAGTTVTLIVPETITTFRGLLVRASGQPFLLPLVAVERVVATEPVTVGGRDMIRLDGDLLPCGALAAVLGIDAEPVAAEGRAYAIVAAASGRVGLLVDEVVGDREVLVKEFEPPLVRVRNVAAAGLLGAGELVLILRPADLIAGVHSQRGSAARERPAEEPDGPPRVLVVDDAVTTRAMERGLLELAGYTVEVAVDGVEAWAALKTDHFDLVVSDVDMPRMDGFELTSRIRADSALGDLPVILVSALEAREDKERGIEVGANAYVVKSSFEQSNLLEIIHRLGVRPAEVARA
jgi:two-component system chemotaxis sensor kinase CheA